jgi:hypothetical protein
MMQFGGGVYTKPEQKQYTNNIWMIPESSKTRELNSLQEYRGDKKEPNNEKTDTNRKIGKQIYQFA